MPITQANLKIPQGTEAPNWPRLVRSYLTPKRLINEIARIINKKIKTNRKV